MPVSTVVPSPCGAGQSADTVLPRYTCLLYVMQKFDHILELFIRTKFVSTLPREYTLSKPLTDATGIVLITFCFRFVLACFMDGYTS